MHAHVVPSQPAQHLGPQAHALALLAGRVAEVLDGLDAVTVNDSVRWERAEISGRLQGLYDLRLQIYRRKFAIKYLNNLLAQVTPFLFYAVGGLLASMGSLPEQAPAATFASTDVR